MHSPQSAPIEGLQQHEAWMTRIVLNGFPKSGLHLCEAMAAGIMEPFMIRNWVGVFSGNGWKGEFVQDNVVRTCALINYMNYGAYVKGHLGYHKLLHQILERAGTGMIFIFRDLRDVAVSQMYHILHEKDWQFLHQGRKTYQAMEDKEEVLRAIITGVDDYSGLFERWELYAPWLEVDGVLPMPFEFMRLASEEACETILRYLVGYASDRLGFHLILNKEDTQKQIERMMKYVGQPERSSTYRKGAVGDWREEFSPEIKKLFKAHAGDWLIRLGYEKDNNW
jgi:hypothetical protein